MLVACGSHPYACQSCSVTQICATWSNPLAELSMSETVAVLIVTRNRTEDLSATVSSVNAQDFPIHEIIVVDNGSDQAIADANEATFAKDARVRYVRLARNLGVAGGRNHAMGLASGSLLLELDD